MLISPYIYNIERTTRICNWNFYSWKKSNKFYCDWQEVHVGWMLIGRKHITPVFVAESSDNFSIWILEKHQWTNNSWSRSLKATDNENFEGSLHMSSFKLILRGDIYQVRLMAFNNFRSVNDESV